MVIMCDRARLGYRIRPSTCGSSISVRDAACAERQAVVFSLTAICGTRAARRRCVALAKADANRIRPWHRSHSLAAAHWFSEALCATPLRFLRYQFVLACLCGCGRLTCTRRTDLLVRRRSLFSQAWRALFAPRQLYHTYSRPRLLSGVAGHMYVGVIGLRCEGSHTCYMPVTVVHACSCLLLGMDIWTWSLSRRIIARVDVADPSIAQQPAQA